MFIHFVFFSFNLLIFVESQVAFYFYGNKWSLYPTETLVILSPHLKTFFSWERANIKGAHALIPPETTLGIVSAVIISLSWSMILCSPWLWVKSGLMDGSAHQAASPALSLTVVSNAPRWMSSILQWKPGKTKLTFRKILTIAVQKQRSRTNTQTLVFTNTLNLHLSGKSILICK